MRLETDRLLLRVPEPADAESYAAVWGEPEVVRFLSGKLWTLEDARAAIDRMRRHWDWFGIGLFSVVRKEDGGVLGRVGFLVWDPERWVNGHAEKLRPPLETEVGWTLGREHWNRGYATEGALACRDWALAERGLTRLISLIARGNLASVRVAEKIGETFERAIADAFFRRPVDLYSMEAGGQAPAR
ncbi:MAG TPA: GNAT family N-acetyltransferase [Gaiellaceae bacterium]|nr:GNAT family N-acetyltransferase [Gaiellaceae bacterium]